MGFAGYLVKPVREASLVAAAECLPGDGARRQRCSPARPQAPRPIANVAADLPRPSPPHAAHAAAPATPQTASKFFWPRTIRSTRC